MKKFLSLLVLVGVLLTSPITVCAEETDSPSEDSQTEMVIMDEDKAVLMAQQFVDSVSGENGITAQNPVKIYDTSDHAVGFSVSFYKDGNPYGYVIFDTLCTELLSQYSIGADIQSPYDYLVDGDISVMSADSEIRAYRVDIMTYGVAATNSQSIQLYDGETVPKSNDSITRSGGKSDWDDIFIPLDKLYQNYNVTQTGHIEQFSAYSEDYVIAQTNRYACGISALMACADFYQVRNARDFKGDYLDLWEMTGSYFLSGSSVYGSTPRQNLGAGFVEFCTSRGRKDVRFSFTPSPSYTLFKNCIEGGNVALFHATLDTEDGEEGHAMAVQGYAKLVNKNTSASCSTVMVADGWNSTVAYVNLNFSQYVSVGGSIFSTV